MCLCFCAVAGLTQHCLSRTKMLPALAETTEGGVWLLTVSYLFAGLLAYVAGVLFHAAFLFIE